MKANKEHFPMSKSIFPPNLQRSGFAQIRVQSAVRVQRLRDRVSSLHSRMDEDVLNSVLLSGEVECVGDWLSGYLQVSVASPH